MRQGKAGLNLILKRGDEDQTKVGFILRTLRGFDALAQTYRDSPENSKVHLATIAEAQAFVEFSSLGRSLTAREALLWKQDTPEAIANGIEGIVCRTN